MKAHPDVWYLLPLWWRELGWPLRGDLLLGRRRPPAIVTAGERMDEGRGLPSREKRVSISSFWRECSVWISIMCLLEGRRRSQGRQGGDIRKM